VQAAVFRQVNNAKALVPDLQVEVVFHGQAILAVMNDSLQLCLKGKVGKGKGRYPGRLQQFAEATQN